MSIELDAMIRALQTLQALEARVEGRPPEAAREREALANAVLASLPAADEYLRVELGIFMRAEPGEARIVAGKALLRAVALDLLRRTGGVPRAIVPPPAAAPTGDDMDGPESTVGAGGTGGAEGAEDVAAGQPQDPPGPAGSSSEAAA